MKTLPWNGVLRWVPSLQACSLAAHTPSRPNDPPRTRLLTNLLRLAGKGANVLLGPGMCVARFPRNGRNFEYASGEDPYLGYIMVQPVVKGIQSMGVMANGKHWVNNNQEINRTSNNAIVDERTRYEM